MSQWTTPLRFGFKDKTSLIFDIEPCVNVFSKLTDSKNGNALSSDLHRAITDVATPKAFCDITAVPTMFDKSGRPPT